MHIKKLQGLTDSTNGCGGEFQTQVLLTAFLIEKKLKYTIHKPCGANNVNVPCMQLDRGTNRERCNEHFPQPVRSVATINDMSGRVEYTRVKSTKDRRTASNFVDGKWTNVPVGDEWVANYNPYLLLMMRFDYHIHVEVVTATDCNCFCLCKVYCRICT